MKLAAHINPSLALACAFLTLASAHGVDLEAPSSPKAPASPATSATPSANAKTNDLFAGRAAADAIEKITEKMKAPVRALLIDLSPTRISLQVHDSDTPTRVNEYTYELRTGLLGRLAGGGGKIAGPTPVQLNPVDPGLKENLFPLAEIDFTAVPATVAEALKQARIEGGVVEAITIGRQFPLNKSGPVRWEISVMSPDEIAVAHADAKGKILSLDLSRTARAEKVDFTQGGEALDKAITKIREQLGDKAIFGGFTVSRNSLSFDTRDPRNPTDVTEYAYDINGIRKVSNPFPADIQRLIQKPAKEIGLFAIGDVDWSRMPALKKEALEKITIEGGQLRDIQLYRPTAPNGHKPVHWKFTVFAGPFGESGTMEFDAKTGAPGRLILPKSLQKEVNLVEVNAVKRLVAAARAEFGADAVFKEISIHSDKAFLTALSAKGPTETQQYLYDETQGFRPWGNKGERAPQAAEETLRLSIADVESALKKLPELAKKAPARSGLPEGEIERITFFRQSPFYPRNRDLLVEVRVKSGANQGRVIFNGKGDEIDAVPYSNRTSAPIEPAKLRRVDMADGTAARVAKFDSHFTTFIDLNEKYGESRWNKTRASDPAGVLKLPREDFQAWAKLQNEMRDCTGQILKIFAERTPPADAIASTKAKTGARRRAFWEAQNTIWDLSSQQAKLLEANWDEWVAHGFPDDESQQKSWQKEAMRLQGEIDAANKRSTESLSPQ